MNIAILRAFVRLRQLLAGDKALADRLSAMESRYDKQSKVVFEILRQRMEPSTDKARPLIGFISAKHRKT